MTILKKIRDYLFSSDYRFLVNARNPLLQKTIKDETYIRKMFRICFGRDIDLENPKTFNEKLQWMKLNVRDPEQTKMVDKSEAKTWAADRIGPEYIIPTLGVWDSFDEIDFDKLPEQFVLKCTHDSGGLSICTDKKTFDINAAKEKINKSLKRNYYYAGREWPYKNVKPRIIAEQYMTDSDNSSCLTDYKFFCFGGHADCVMLCLDRNTGDTKFYFFDKEWKLKRLNVRSKNAPEDFTLPKPEHMDEMFEIAEKLSAGFRFVRVDLYESCGRVYFGEMTFFSDSGFDKDILEETDKYWGELINLN